jgi:hypothetical protein
MVKWWRQEQLWAAGLAGALLALPAAAQAQCGGGCATCGGGGGTPAGCASPKLEKCPPKFTWISEGKPCIKFKCGCPRPVCDPCKLEHFGYYQACWAPWPYPPDWSHCPYLPPGAALPPPPVPPFTPKHRYYQDGSPYDRDRSIEEPRFREESPMPRKSPPATDELPPPAKIEKGGSVYYIQPRS